MHVLAAVATSTTSWAIGYTIAIVVVLVVVALVVPILLLARSIGKEAGKINESLAGRAEHRGPGRAEHHDRVRRGHRRRAPAGTIQVGRLTMDRTHIDPGEPVVGRGHRRLRRRPRGRRAADDPGLLVRTIDRRVVEIRATLEQAAANTADTA